VGLFHSPCLICGSLISYLWCLFVGTLLVCGWVLCSRWVRLRFSCGFAVTLFGWLTVRLDLVAVYRLPPPFWFTVRGLTVVRGLRVPFTTRLLILQHSCVYLLPSIRTRLFRSYCRSRVLVAVTFGFTVCLPCHLPAGWFPPDAAVTDALRYQFLPFIVYRYAWCRCHYVYVYAWLGSTAAGCTFGFWYTFGSVAWVTWFLFCWVRSLYIHGCSFLGSTPVDVAFPRGRCTLPGVAGLWYGLLPV